MVITTHKEYQDLLSSIAPKHAIKNIEYYIAKNKILENVMHMMPSAMMIVNYQTGEYLFMSDSIKSMLGISSDYFYRNSQYITQKEIIHPDDVAKIGALVLPRIIKNTIELSKFNLKNYVISFNFRAKRIDGKYLQLLQRSIVLETTSDNMPIINMSNLTDISNYKTDDKMIFSISRFDEKDGFETISTELLGENDTYNALTSKETSVLALLAAGLSAKEIAQKQSVSEFTTKAHLRNIKEKLGISKATELVKFALSNGITLKNQ